MSRIYRHELKFLCRELELQLIESKIKHICVCDPHAEPEGTYRIRSMYFDTFDSGCYHENEAGVDNRSKYRIRIYNCSDAVIKLERKGSMHNKKYKDACSISRSQFEQILQRDPVEHIIPQQELLREFVAEGQMTLLKPSVIVEYMRTPYIYPAGNVRITFDRHITSSSSMHFFDKDIPGRGIMPENIHILEVKYDEMLPGAIRELLNGTCGLYRTSYSKYALCREYSVR